MSDLDLENKHLTKVKTFLLNSEKPILIFSKLSQEGIASSSILLKVLQRLNKNFSISFFKDLDESKIKELTYSTNKTAIIIDPSEQDLFLLTTIKEKYFITLSSSEKTVSEKTYLLAKALDEKNQDLVYLTFISLLNLENETLLSEAEKSNKLEQITGFLLLGSNTRPIHKTIELSIDPFLLGFSGSEEHAMNLFKDIGISLKVNNNWTSLQDLNDFQINKLKEAIGLTVYAKEELFGKTMLLKDEERNNPLRDLREFNLFLEACIMYEKPTIALAKCILSKNYKNRAGDVLKEYRQEISKALALFYTSKREDLLFEKENCIIINYKGLISEVILEKTTKLIQNSKVCPQKKRIITLCQTKLDEIKCVLVQEEKRTDSNIKNFLASLPEEITSEGIYEGCIVLKTKYEGENKLLELLLEHFETTKIEEIRKE